MFLCKMKSVWQGEMLKEEKGGAKRNDGVYKQMDLLVSSLQDKGEKKGSAGTDIKGKLGLRSCLEGD